MSSSTQPRQLKKWYWSSANWLWHKWKNWISIGKQFACQMSQIKMQLYFIFGTYCICLFNAQWIYSFTCLVFFFFFLSSDINWFASFQSFKIQCKAYANHIAVYGIKSSIASQAMFTKHRIYLRLQQFMVSILIEILIVYRFSITLLASSNTPPPSAYAMSNYNILVYLFFLNSIIISGESFQVHSKV